MYLTVREYAKAKGLTRGAIYIKIRNGQIPKDKISIREKITKQRVMMIKT